MLACVLHEHADLRPDALRPLRRSLRRRRSPTPASSRRPGPAMPRTVTPTTTSSSSPTTTGSETGVTWATTPVRRHRRPRRPDHRGRPSVGPRPRLGASCSASSRRARRPERRPGEPDDRLPDGRRERAEAVRGVQGGPDRPSCLRSAPATRSCRSRSTTATTAPIPSAPATTQAYWARYWSKEAADESVHPVPRGHVRGAAACGPDNDAWTRALPIDLGDGGSGSATGSIDVSGQARWYRFAIQPGTRAHVDLTDVPANYDVALFTDIAQAFNEVDDTRRRPAAVERRVRR